MPGMSRVYAQYQRDGAERESGHALKPAWRQEVGAGPPRSARSQPFRPSLGFGAMGLI
jgi:hypothetical protein